MTSVSAKQTSKELNHALKTLLRDGKTEQAHDLCKENGLIFSYSSNEFSQKALKRSVEESSSKFDNVTTQEKYTDPDDDPDSTISIGAYNLVGDNDDGHQYLIFDWI